VIVGPAVYWECIQFVNTRVAASSEGAFQLSFSSCIKKGHLLQAAHLVSATSNGAENTTVLVDQAAYLLVSATSNGWNIYCACRSGSESSCVRSCEWGWHLLYHPCWSFTSACQPPLWYAIIHSCMHVILKKKEMPIAAPFFTFDKTKHDSWGGIDNNCLNCEWGDHNPFCTLGHTNPPPPPPPPPPPANDIRNQQGSSQQPSNVLLTLIEIADLFFTYSTAFW